MRRRLVLLFGAALLVCAAVPVRAQAQGGHAAAVLRLAPAPRLEALGGAASLSNDDPFAVRLNPAAAAGAHPGVAVAYRAHPGDVSAGAAAASFGAGGLRAGLAMAFLDLGSVAERVPDEEVGGQRGIATGRRIGGGELALGAALAHGFGPFGVGVGFTLVRTALADARALAAAFDVGASALALDGALVVGAALLGLGPESGPGRAAPLPRIGRIGGELRLGGVERPWILLAGELAGPEDRLRPAAGVEVRVTGSGTAALVLRGGYRGDVERGDALSALALGGGVEIGGWRVDYAYRGVGVLGEAHELGFRYLPSGARR